MQVDLRGRRACLVGVHHGVAEAVRAALAANGAQPLRVELDDAPAATDILIVSHDLDPIGTDVNSERLTAYAAGAARAMLGAGSGRIVHLLSAAAVVPMRRHPAYSAAQAAALVGVRTLAMTVAPKVLVNAVAAGPIGDPGTPESGDPAMLTHIPGQRPGTVEDVANAALFLCDPMNSYMTGQVLTVDGGWTAGYARDF